MKPRSVRINEKVKLSSFELLMEIIGWLRIVASPLLLGGMIGLLAYLAYPGTPMLITAIAMTILGLIIGIIWATRIWKRKGTMRFISGIIAAPQDDLATEEHKINQEN